MSSGSENSDNRETADNTDSYLGQPIDRKGKTLTDEQAKIFNAYNKWKNNLMCLYNHIESYALPYPARTVQFLPNPKQIMSQKNQYKRYTNCPFVYPSHCTVPKQERSHCSAQINNRHSSSTSNNGTDSTQHHQYRTARMTPIYYLQSMNYFVPNRIEEQQDLWNIFHCNNNNNNNNNNNDNNINFSNISGIRQSSLITGILPYDEYMKGGSCVESAYDVYRLRIMPQQPHLIATRSYHEDIAIYWLNYNHLPSPLNAFEKRRGRNNIIPERSGLSATDEDDDDDDIDIDINRKKRKRHDTDDDNDNYPTKKQKLEYGHIKNINDTINNGNIDDNDDDDDDNDSEYDSNEDRMNIEVGTGHGYLIAVGQTSTKTKTGWGLAFNPNHCGMFITGNSDGSIACWDLNMIDNAQCMTKMGKFKNKKHSSDPNIYMKDSKIVNKTFNDGPPYITRQRSDEYHWFEEFEKYGNWSASSSMCSSSSVTNPDVMSVDWCSDSSQIFVSSTANGQISIWDRRSKQIKKKPQLWTWGTSHNQSILSVSWNPIQHSLIASGSKASKVRIWDIRSFNRHIVQLSQHQSAVYHVKWCPYNKYLLASSGSDRMLLMYDLRRSGLKTNNDTNPNDNDTNRDNMNNIDDEGIDSVSKLLSDLDAHCIGNYSSSSCPELVFGHFGHTSCIPEFDWCPSGDLTMISTDMDGIIHCWQPPSGMLNTFSWVIHSQKQNYIINTT